MPPSGPDPPPTSSSGSHSTPAAPAVTPASGSPALASSSAPTSTTFPSALPANGTSGPSSGPISSVAPSGSIPPFSAAEVPDLRSTALYLNRELSWIEFNSRVLAESENEAVPILERLKFHAIVASNLDEFFMVRVAGLKQQLTGDVGELAADGLTANEQLTKISARVHDLISQQMAALMGGVLPLLAADGTFVLVKPDAIPPEGLAALDERFYNEVFPILTPIAIDPGHPFPHLRNKSLNLGVMFDESAEANFGVVQVPMMLSRLIEIPGVKGARHAYVLIEDVVARHAATIFPGVKLRGAYTFRVTRNFDLEIDEEEAEDLLQTIQQELRKRERGNAVRVEVAGSPT